MSDTGGGHRASAQALKAGFDELYADQFQIDIIDLISDHLIWPLNQIPKLYPFMSNDAPWMWKALYGSNSTMSWGNGLAVLGSRLSIDRVRDTFRTYRPDLIISVHPLMQMVSMWAMEKLPQRIPYVTVVTDLSTAHPLWFHPSVDACYVASEHTYKMALAAGLRTDQLHLFGLPIRPAFARPTRAKPELRAALGMDETLPAVLLIGGGEGIGPVEEIAAQLAKHLHTMALPPPGSWSSCAVATVSSRNGLRHSPGRSQRLSTALSTTCPIGWRPAIVSSPRPVQAPSPKR